MTTDTLTRQEGDPAITLRPTRPDDHPFLCALYASTREQELAAVPWDAAQKAAFVRMQFDAQHAHYQEHYAGAAFDVILVDGQPAGRLYVDRARTTKSASSTSRCCPTTATAASGRRCCADCNQRLRPPTSRCASTSSASIPRYGSTSGSGSGRSSIGAFICSWNGGWVRKT